jgi:hypothetical protein
MATFAPNQLHSVPLAELQPDPTQPRKYLDPLAFEELTASVGQIGAMQNKIGDLDLLSFSKGDREMVMEAMTSLQNALNEAFNRAAQ